MNYKEQIEGLVRSFNDEMTDPFRVRPVDKNGKFEFNEHFIVHGKVKPEDPTRITKRLSLVFNNLLSHIEQKRIIVMEFEGDNYDTTDVEYQMFWQHLVRYTLFAIKAEGLMSINGPLDVIPIADFIRGSYGK